MWTKISSRKGTPVRMMPAVCRYSSGAATLVLPPDYVAGSKADVFYDGKDKLAFVLGDVGEFSVFQCGGDARFYRITITPDLRERIPLGTTDVDLVRDGDMLVLDLSLLEGVNGSFPFDEEPEAHEPKPVRLSKEERIKARERVRQWAVDHPWGQQADCAADLGLNKSTVSNYAQVIRAEWRDKP